MSGGGLEEMDVLVASFVMLEGGWDAGGDCSVVEEDELINGSRSMRGGGGSSESWLSWTDDRSIRS